MLLRAGALGNVNSEVTCNWIRASLRRNSRTDVAVELDRC